MFIENFHKLKWYGGGARVVKIGHTVGDSSLLGVRVKYVRKELGDIVELVAFESVAGTVLLVNIAAMQLA